ncbi:serine/threonine-protein kinase [Pseudonocardia humida]|uniref:non-specific serine/threonine protein kinase n=1 Tax=Pseudonocardia humida TaxID=2800819 RepID=A0ABT0ZYK3_9PSEU|nr:serine/threonine-protein kinase [Pseudonocardia humida]MCO1655816.1 protein kinase [Pseudonocardia humida]
MTSVPPLEIPGLENPEVIGQGGFGTVFKVEEPEFGRSVAVKVIEERLNGDSVRRAFLRECQAMGALSGHPHIVTVLRGGTTDTGRAYIVMDLMSEGSLGDRIARDGPLPWPEVLEIGVMVAGALETAHRAGILHLDMKPANVLVSKYGEPKLADFGISRLPGVTETTDGRVKASVAFAAPERLLDGTATVASDIYGLGATLYTLLVGRPAFTSETGHDDLLATVARVVRDPVPDLRPRGVPDVVARAIERMMAKSPAERFPSAADAAVEMQAAQRSTGRPVTRAVIEGERPTHGDTVTWAAPRSVPGVAPLRPLVPGFAEADRAGSSGPSAFAGPGQGPSGPTPRVPAWISAPYGGQSADPPPTEPVPAQQAPTRAVAGPQQPPHWAPPPMAARHRRGPIIAGVAAAVVVIVGAGMLAWYLNRPPTISTGSGPTTTTTAAAPSTSRTTTPPPPTSTTIDIPFDATVAIDPSVTHPAAVDARSSLREYILGINEARYEDAFAYFSPDSATFQGGIDAWAEGQLTTIIVDARITAVRDIDPVTIEVDMTFTSTQAAEDGPDGQECTYWNLAYEMDGSSPVWLIRGASAITPPVAC